MVKVLFSERELKKALRDTLTRAALSGLLYTEEIRQSDCEISSNCGKSFFFSERKLKKALRDTLTPAALSGLLPRLVAIVV